MIFLSPLDVLIAQVPFSFFAEFWVQVTSVAQGSISLGIFLGGDLARGLYRPPAPRRRKPARPSPQNKAQTWARAVPPTRPLTPQDQGHGRGSSGPDAPLCRGVAAGSRA